MYVVTDTRPVFGFLALLEKHMFIITERWDSCYNENKPNNYTIETHARLEGTIKLSTYQKTSLKVLEDPTIAIRYSIEIITRAGSVDSRDEVACAR